MRVLCLSREVDFFRKATMAFSGRIREISCHPTASAFLKAVPTGTWDAFLIDFDLLSEEYSSPLDFSGKIDYQAPILFIASSKWADQREAVEAAGQKLLLKPLVIGEIGLALQKLHKQKKTLEVPLPLAVEDAALQV